MARKHPEAAFKTVTTIDFDEFLTLVGFENMIRDVERSWRPIAKRYRYPKQPSKRNPTSLGTYARDILSGLEQLRKILRASPENEAAVTLALEVGYKIGDAPRQFFDAPFTLTGLRQRRKAPAAGRRSAEARRQLAAERHKQVDQEAQRLRTLHPRQDKLSTRQLATRVSLALGLKFETVYKDLRQNLPTK